MKARIKSTGKIINVEHVGHGFFRDLGTGKMWIWNEFDTLIEQDENNNKNTLKKEECICPYCGQTVSIYICPPILDSEEECPHCKKLFLCHVNIKI